MFSTGFTFDEKVLKDYELEAFFDLLPIELINSIEVSPDTRILSRKTYQNIGKYCELNNINLNFHVPLFIKNSFYDFSNDNTSSIKDYTKLFSIIESLRQYNVKIPSLVIHGATIISKNQTKAFDDTLYMIDYLLNFISKKNLNLNLSFETLSKNSGSIGKSREEVIKVINEFKSPNLNICLDLCHDYYNSNKFLPFTEGFLEKVNYVHIHGNNNNLKHVSTLDYFDYNSIFNNVKFNQIINIELLKDCAQETYYSDLIKDIYLLEKLKKI